MNTGSFLQSMLQQESNFLICYGKTSVKSTTVRKHEFRALHKNHMSKNFKIEREKKNGMRAHENYMLYLCGLISVFSATGNLGFRYHV